MKQTRLWAVVGLALLTAGVVLLIQVGRGRVSLAQPAMAMPMERNWTQAEPLSGADSNQEKPEGRQESESVRRRVALPVVFKSLYSSGLSPFGVTMYGAVNNGEGLAMMKDAGAGSATTLFVWEVVEGTQGYYNWSSFDASAQNAQAAGMQLFVLFTGNPKWAAELPGGPVYNPQDLVNIVTRMVERYDCDGRDDAPGHPCVRYWSFYAEPDNGRYQSATWGKGYWGHNGAGYAAMLESISPAMHAADPQAKVLIGGLAYDFFEEDGGAFVRSFLADTLAALNTYPGGAREYIDAMAFHYYPIATDRWPTLIEKAAEIRGIMADHGVGDLPLLVPEFGYWSSPCHGSSEPGQANWLVRSFVRGLSIDVELMGYYKVADTAVACDEETDLYPDRTSGLRDLTGRLKPAYYAYKTLTREIAGLSYVEPSQAAGAEGYVFAMDTGRLKTVLWSRCGTVRVVFPHTHLRVVTATGAQTFDIWDNEHEDGAPGDLDYGIVGQIELEIDEDAPIFVEQR